MALATSATGGAGLSPISAGPVGVPAPTSSVSFGGSAAGLFPTVAPGSTPVANVSRLPGGNPMGSEIAEVGGLAALAVAMLLAVTRLSFRRPAQRPAPRHAAGSTAAAASPSDVQAGRNGQPN
jgi:hypothetical protein